MKWLQKGNYIHHIAITLEDRIQDKYTPIQNYRPIIIVIIIIIIIIIIVIITMKWLQKGNYSALI